jgi:hypothetical protein
MYLKWDGTFLGKFDTENVSDIETVDGCKYVSIKLNDQQSVIGHIKSIRNNLPFIIEEIKHFFGLYHLNTHKIEINNHFFAFVNASLADENIILNPTLGQFGGIIDDNFKRHVQNIIVFREVLGIKVDLNNHTHVCLTTPFKPYPIADLDTSLGAKTQLSVSTRKKWLGKLSYCEILRRMLNIPKIDEEKAVFKLRSQLDNVIRRIDKNYIYIVNEIMQRVSEILLDK